MTDWEWWRDQSTILKNLVEDDRGISSLHCKMINGIFEYAIVWWFHGTPTLNLYFVEGIVQFDISQGGNIPR